MAQQQNHQNKKKVVHSIKTKIQSEGILKIKDAK